MELLTLTLLLVPSLLFPVPQLNSLRAEMENGSSPGSIWSLQGHLKPTDGQTAAVKSQ